MIRQIDPKDVVVKNRFRKEAGDIDALKESIAELGLLHPIVVSSEYQLIAGWRRLQAVKRLKWEKVPVNVVKNLDDALLAIKAEQDENTCRLELLVTEAVALGMQIEKLEKPKAKERQGERKDVREKKLGGKIPRSSEKTRDKAGERAGMSGRTFEKAKQVIESGDTEAIEQMDRTGKVGPAHNRVKQKSKIKELEEKAKEFSADQPNWTLLHGDCITMLKSLEDQDYARLVFADPPYNIGVDYGDGKKADLMSDDDYIRFCRNWMRLCWHNLADDGSFWLLVSDEYAAELCVEAKKLGFYLRSWIKWFEGFGVNCTNNFNRTTRHLFWFVVDPRKFVFHSHEVMRPSDRQTKYNDKRASSGGKIENDLWDIPRLTGTSDERVPGFPTQLPLQLLTRIVRCATDPGDLILDPFNGSGTTGVAAIGFDRKYIGIEKSEKYINLADKRLRCLEANEEGG